MATRKWLGVALVLVALVLSGIALFVTEVQLLDLQFAHRFVRSIRRRDDVVCTDTNSTDHCVVPLLKLGEFNGDKTQLYSDSIFQIDWSQHTTLADVVHLGKIQRACTTHKDSVISWRFGLVDGEYPNLALLNRSDDQGVVEELKRCPSFDIYVPSGIRGQGYCEDAAAYVKYGHARMLPRWALETEFFDKTVNRPFSYHELCPRTPLVLFNHYWDDQRAHAKWPATKPLYLMPNIEMYELVAEHYWQADVILCKTIVCTEYVSKWFAQEGNPKLTRVLYVRHTTTDVATIGLLASGEKITQREWRHIHTRRKNFTDSVFIHAAGGSVQKGSAYIFDCWLSRPDLPPVDVYMSLNLYRRLFHKKFDARLRSTKNKNIRLHLGELDAAAFGSMIANASLFLCPSRMEGYGHYINQARASGGLILVPDVPPMNELVTSSSGVLMRATPESLPQQFLSGASKHSLGLRNVSGFVSAMNEDDVCEGVDSVLRDLKPARRQELAHRARQQYLYDTAFFAWKMQQLREELQPAKSG